jgi:hypothetical protein
MANRITIRLRRPKAEIQARAKPNLNAWVNDLIEQALGPERVDWSEHYQRRKKRKPAAYQADAVRRESR